MLCTALERRPRGTTVRVARGCKRSHGEHHFAWLVVLATGGGRWKGVVVALACFSVVEWGVMTDMIVRQVGQTQFAPSRTTMSDTEMFIYSAH